MPRWSVGSAKFLLPLPRASPRLPVWAAVCNRSRTKVNTLFKPVLGSSVNLSPQQDLNPPTCAKCQNVPTNVAISIRRTKVEMIHSELYQNPMVFVVLNYSVSHIEELRQMFP
jgi:hypothetical protein